ncbi:MAG TPA: hypothetical protein DEA08_16190 [Planctomycetes bacterium]|nr:hypothetical protein [Planctomycetota bacterium]
MSTCDRWLLRRFFGAYLAFLVVGLLLFLAIDLPVNAARLQRKGLAQSVPLRYGTLLPELFYLAAPYLTLLSALWVTTALRRSNELLGLLSLGYSSRRLAWPLLLGALLVAPLTWADRELLLPALGDLRRAEARLGGVRDHWSSPRPIPDAQGGVFMAAGYHLGLREARELTFVQLDPGGRERRSIHAERGRWVEEGGAGRWLLSNGVVIEEAGPGERVTPFAAKGHWLDTPITPADVETAHDPRYASAEEIRERLRRTPGFPALEVELWRRYGQPLAGAVLLLVALPLTLGHGEGRPSLRGLLSLGAALCYFVAVTFCSELGGQGLLPPAAAVALPPLAFATFGALLGLRARV